MQPLLVAWARAHLAIVGGEHRITGWRPHLRAHCELRAQLIQMEALQRVHQDSRDLATSRLQVARKVLSLLSPQSL